MKKLLLISSILMLICNILTATRIDYTAPEFMQCIYGQYSTNYINTIALGRGHTGIAIKGNIVNSLLNPASLEMNQSGFDIELAMKSESDEFAEYIFRESSRAGDNDATYVNRKNIYKSSNPLNFVGFGFPYKEKWNFGFSFSTPKTLKFDNYTKKVKAGKLYVVKPAYNVYQYSFTSSYKYTFLRFGLTTFLSYHSYRDNRDYWNFGKYSDEALFFSFKSGIMAKWRNFNFGLTYTPQLNRDFDLTYEKYSVTIPAIISGGTSVKLGNFLLSCDLDYEQCSQQNSEFEDRLTIKSGFEYEDKKMIYRLGYMFVPGIYEGEINIPTGQNEVYPTDVDYIYFSSIDQYLITTGVTIKSEFINLNLGGMVDLSGETDIFQFQLSTSVIFEGLKKKIMETIFD